MCYKRKFVLHIRNDEMMPVFGKIVLTLLDSDKKVFFIVQCMETLFFCNHSQSYAVQNVNEWIYVAYDMLCSIAPSYTTVVQDSLHVILKE